MTDPDPAPPRRPRRPAAADPAGAAPAPAATPPASDAPPTGTTALRDRWWWSPTLSIVLGLVVVGYQLEPLRGPDPLWGNWLVAALGAAVAVWGVVRLVRAARLR